MIPTLNDDTDVFILLLILMNWIDKQRNVQIERWNGSVLEIKTTCADLEQKCLQLPGIHTLMDCDKNSYHYYKG